MAKKQKVVVEFYQSGTKRNWRWRIKRGNNKILDASSECFSGGKYGAKRNFRRVRAAMNLVSEAQLKAA